ncbi:MAG: hypothetical protein KZQ67_14140, partial [gamma proteobacterium symbiont of Bathyaustriella thionipta]|nr:hypothetical protein [gamma proteobacterium symbiont of Bathyaustriella thionipta]MCU7957741.1 hypothetical protein [gamma proteobacterium symbiont of Bathyaustriella thionipta]
RHVGFNKLHNFSVKLFFSIFFKFMLNSYNNFLLPGNDFEIQEDDQLLICGDKESMHLMCWTVSNINVYNYIYSGYELAGGYFWCWYYKMKKMYKEKQ